MVLAGIVVVAAPLAAQPQCEDRLVQAVAVPNGYRARGDRCEGVYARPIAGTAFVVLSLTAAFDRFAPGSTPPVIALEWRPTAEPVRVRVQGLRPRLNYRMDAALAPGATGYRWPSDILRVLRLSADDIGVLAWTDARLGDRALRVFLPVALHTGPGAAETGRRYRCVIVPGRELTEVYVSLRRIGAGGTDSTVVFPPRERGLGFYPAEYPVALTVTAPPDAGLYALDLSVRMRDSTTAVERIVFRQGAP